MLGLKSVGALLSRLVRKQESDSAWGIEFTDRVVKGLRVRRIPATNHLCVDRFTYFARPQDAQEFSREQRDQETIQDIQLFSYQQCVSRKDQVAISIPGSDSLFRSFSLPPLRKSKIQDVVAYEAKHYIPFDLASVCWDYQLMPGHVLQDDYVCEAEYSLVAATRNIVSSAYQKLAVANLTPRVVQIAPVSLYNFFMREYGKDLNQNETIVVISINSETTDLVIGDRKKLWLRTIPLGENHHWREFIKNGSQKVEEPPKEHTSAAAYDLLTEILRSLSYFKTMNREACVGKVYLVGKDLPQMIGPIKKELQVPFERITSYKEMVIDDGLKHDVHFLNHLPELCGCYGLALQALELATIQANLAFKE